MHQAGTRIGCRELALQWRMGESAVDGEMCPHAKANGMFCHSHLEWGAGASCFDPGRKMVRVEALVGDPG
jgi:hypothetical protein